MIISVKNIHFMENNKKYNNTQNKHYIIIMMNWNDRLGNKNWRIEIWSGWDVANNKNESGQQIGKDFCMINNLEVIVIVFECREIHKYTREQSLRHEKLIINWGTT